MLTNPNAQIVSILRSINDREVLKVQSDRGRVRENLHGSSRVDEKVTSVLATTRALPVPYNTQMVEGMLKMEIWTGVACLVADLNIWTESDIN